MSEQKTFPTAMPEGIFAHRFPAPPKISDFPNGFDETYGKPITYDEIGISTRALRGLASSKEQLAQQVNEPCYLYREAAHTDTRIWKIVKKAAKDLGVDPPKSLLVAALDPAIKNQAMCEDRTIIFSRKAIDLLNDAELGAIVRHEIHHLDQEAIAEMQKKAVDVLDAAPTQLKGLKNDTARQALTVNQPPQQHGLVNDSISWQTAQTLSQLMEYECDSAAILSGATSTIMDSAMKKVMRSTFRESYQAIDEHLPHAYWGLRESIRDVGSDALRETLSQLKPQKVTEWFDSLSDDQMMEWIRIAGHNGRVTGEEPKMHPNWRDRMANMRDTEHDMYLER